MLQVINGPDTGRFTISIDGEMVAEVRPLLALLYARAGLILKISLGASEHTVVISNDGNGSTSIGRMIIAPQAEVQSREDRIGAMLEEHKDKVCFLVSGTLSSLWDAGDISPLGWGGEGRGIGGNSDLVGSGPPRRSGEGRRGCLGGNLCQYSVLVGM